MNDATFQGLLLQESPQGIQAAVSACRTADLPAGSVRVRVSHSSLNYKDALILTGQGRLVRHYPHIPGIDFAGVVEHSEDPRHPPGAQVLLTGWRVGETRWGGYAERVQVPGDWLLPIPAGLSAREAMAIGTAGFTAMLALQALEAHGLGAATHAPVSSDVLVTGASGGVGSMATLLLAHLGYRVTAVTGRPENADYLYRLGATTLMERAALASLPEKPLLRERWDGCIDSVGGAMLAHVLAEMRYGSAVAACGLAGGATLSTSVVPFLLRGIRLLGIDSVLYPQEERWPTWQRLSEQLPRALLETLITDITLADVPQYAQSLLAGQVRGRLVIHMRPTD